MVRCALKVGVFARANFNLHSNRDASVFVGCGYKTPHYRAFAQIAFYWPREISRPFQFYACEVFAVGINTNDEFRPKKSAPFLRRFLSDRTRKSLPFMNQPPLDNTTDQQQRKNLTRENLIFRYLLDLEMIDLIERNRFFTCAEFLDYFIWRGKVVDLRGAGK